MFGLFFLEGDDCRRIIQAPLGQVGRAISFGIRFSFAKLAHNFLDCKLIGSGRAWSGHVPTLGCGIEFEHEFLCNRFLSIHFNPIHFIHLDGVFPGSHRREDKGSRIDCARIHEQCKSEEDKNSRKEPKQNVSRLKIHRKNLKFKLAPANNPDSSAQTNH